MYQHQLPQIAAICLLLAAIAFAGFGTAQLVALPSTLRASAPVLVESSSADTGVSFSSEVTNGCDEPVFVNSVVRSCKCSKVAIRKGWLEPGEIVQLEGFWALDDSSIDHATTVTVRWSRKTDPVGTIRSLVIPLEVAARSEMVVSRTPEPDPMFP